MFDESDPTAPPAPSPETAPSPSVAPSPALAPSPARYAYLVGRLRGRQITIEEATELFELQQQMVIRARMAAAAIAAPRVGAPMPRARPAAPTSTRTEPTVNPIASPDALWETLPALAGALGIFAALLKRAQSGSVDPEQRSASGARPRPPKPPAP